MPRLIAASDAQAQLLETALGLYRQCYRQHRDREGLRVPFEIEDSIYGGL